MYNFFKKTITWFKIIIMWNCVLFVNRRVNNNELLNRIICNLGKVTKSTTNLKWSFWSCYLCESNKLRASLEVSLCKIPNLFFCVGTNSYTLTNLVPDSNYTVFMLPHAKTTLGRPSALLHFATLQTGPWIR